jgi:hypothetical protein
MRPEFHENVPAICYYSKEHIGYDPYLEITVPTPPPPDTTPPVSSVNPIEPYWQLKSPWTVSSTVSDDPSGISKVELYYRYSTDNSTWSGWICYGSKSRPPWSWEFTTETQGYYKFHSIAVDGANNREPAPSEADSRCGYVDARKWFPVLKFSGGESNYPCSFYFDGDNDVTNNPQNYDVARNSGRLPPFYAYVHPVSDKERFTLQYWFYFAEQKRSLYFFPSQAHTFTTGRHS